MTIPSLGNARQYVLAGVYAVLILYPVTMFVIKGLRSEYYGALFLLSLIALVVTKFRLKPLQLSRDELLVLSSFLILFLVAFISYAWFGFTEEGGSRLGRYNLFLFAIPIFFLFRITQPKEEIVWLGIVVGCYVAFGRAILEEMDLVQEIVRGKSRIDLNKANGVMNPIRFGCLTLVMGFIALAGTLYLRKIHLILRLLGLLGFIAGLGASILAETRGAWIAIPLLLIIAIRPFLAKQKKSIRYLIGVGIILCALIVILTPVTGVKARFDVTTNEINNYLEKDIQNSPVGVRLFMFETAFQAFTENKFFGVGVGGYQKFAKGYYFEQKPAFGEIFFKWKNPHNEYLLHAATRGVIGLVALFILFLSGIWYFARRQKRRDGSYRFSIISGLLLYIGFMHYGLTIALFEHRNFLLFFAIYSMVFLAHKPLDGGLQSNGNISR